jgi:hypothetical protein
MSKIFAIVALTAGLFAFNAPAQAASSCAYAISKLQAQIGYEKGTMDTSAASAAAAQAAAFNATAEASRAKGTTTAAPQSDDACRKAVVAGWNALHS